MSIFYVKTRQELNEWVVRHALSPRAEPLPEYGREGMVAIREFYKKLADDEGTVQFYANHPSKYNSFLIKPYRVSFLESIFKHGSILKLVFRRQPIGNILLIDFVWIRILTIFQIILHCKLGSGFEPLSRLFFHTLCLDLDSNRYSHYLFTVCLDPDSNRYPNCSFSP
jgi:hypothetical protein